MRSEKWSGTSAAQRLADIIKYVEIVERQVDGLSIEDFVGDESRTLATVYALQCVSEAANHLAKHDPFYKELSATEGAFRRTIDAGNIYRHAYGHIDFETVWDSAHSEDLKRMKQVAVEGQQRLLDAALQPNSASENTQQE